MNQVRISDHQKVVSVKLKKKNIERKSLSTGMQIAFWKAFSEGVTEVKSLKGLRLLMQMHRDNEGMQNYNSNLIRVYFMQGIFHLLKVQ